MRNHKWRPARGFGILETLLALFITGIAIAGALLLYDRAQNARMTNDLIVEMNDIVLAVHKAYPNGSYDALNLADIKSLLPRKYVLSDGTLTNPWHNMVAVYPNGSHAFYVVMYGMPKSSCMQLSAIHMDTFPTIKGVQINTWQDNPFEGGSLTVPQLTQACRDSTFNMFAYTSL
ncbi:type IV pilus modification PilV family protein [Gluconobacter cerinus]